MEHVLRGHVLRTDTRYKQHFWSPSNQLAPNRHALQTGTNRRALQADTCSKHTCALNGHTAHTNRHMRMGTALVLPKSRTTDLFFHLRWSLQIAAFVLLMHRPPFLGYRHFKDFGHGQIRRHYIRCVLSKSVTCSNGSFLDKHGFMATSRFLVFSIFCFTLNKYSLSFRNM